MVLAIVVMSTAVFAVVLYFIQKGTETSGLEQKYETAKDASLGGLDVFAKEIIPTAISIAQVTPSTSLTSTLAGFNWTTDAGVDSDRRATDACFSDKLLKSTGNWAAGCSSSTNPKETPDVVFTLKSTNAQPFDVYTKIVDTVAGNSNTSGIMLEGAGVAESSGAMVDVQHFPYMYSMEVQGEREQNPSERANFEVLYAY